MTTLNLSDNNIGVEGALALATALPTMTRLTGLDLRWNKMITSEGKAYLEAAKLKILTITY